MNYQDRMDYQMKDGNINRGTNNKQNKKGYKQNSQNINNDKMNNNNPQNYPYFRNVNRKYRNYAKNGNEDNTNYRKNKRKRKDDHQYMNNSSFKDSSQTSKDDVYEQQNPNQNMYDKKYKKMNK